MDTLTRLRVELEPADVGHADAYPLAKAAANEHDWLVTRPSMAGAGLIIIECRACGETRSFSATPTSYTKPRGDLEGDCQAMRTTPIRP